MLKWPTVLYEAKTHVKIADGPLKGKTHVKLTPVLYKAKKHIKIAVGPLQGKNAC